MVKIIVCAILLTSIAMAESAPQVVFKPLPQKTIAQMERQREFVRGILSKKFPNEHLFGDARDFRLIQKILDAELIPAEKTWELQSLGVVFGDALVKYVSGLSWGEVTDEFGTDPTLRYSTSAKATSLQINALTLISKRIEKGEKVNVQEIADWVANFVKTKAQQYK